MAPVCVLGPLFLLLKLVGALQWDGMGGPWPRGPQGEPGGGGGLLRAGPSLGQCLLPPSPAAGSPAVGTRLPEGGTEEQGPPGESSPRGSGKVGLELGVGSSRVVKSSLVCVLGILIMLANGTVIMVIASSVTGWSHSSRLVLLSLAAADAALALLVVPLNMYHSLAALTLAEEEEGSGCRAVAFINSSIFGASLYSLAGVSLERYMAVFFPLRYGRLLSRRRVTLLIATAWLLPTLLLVPLAVPGQGAVLRVRFSGAALLCEPDYASNATYSLLLAATIFFPAAVVITFSNLRLWLAARSQQQRRRSSPASTGGGAAPRRRHLLRVGPASRVLVPVVIAFYVCWAPCMATILYNALTLERVPEWLEFVALWLPTGSGFLNCFVYFWVNRSFRHKLQSLGHRLCWATPQEGPPHALPTLSAAVQRGGHARPGLPPDNSSSGSSSSLVLSQEAPSVN